MIRKPNGGGLDLIAHADHARLAGDFARHWKNETFEPPRPFAHVLDAIRRHDDSWREQDSKPELTGDGRPSAFTRCLVGTYDAFEEVDLESYLDVRVRATDRAARRDPYSAILISMHTVNLLTEQADLSALDERDRRLHTEFIDHQRARQAELKAAVRADSDLSSYATDEHFQRAFEFLQACDNLSLLICVDYTRSMELRHEHPTTDGEAASIEYRRLDDQEYTCTPWPFDELNLDFQIPHRRLRTNSFESDAALQDAYHDAPIEERTISLVAP